MSNKQPSLFKSITYQLKRGPLGIIFGLCILLFFTYRIGFSEISKSITAANTMFIIPMLVLLFAWLTLGALNLKNMLTPLKTEASFREILHIYSKANMAAMIIPGQIGDSIIINFLRKYSVPTSKGITIFTVDKLITLICYATVALIGVSIIQKNIFPYDFQPLLYKIYTGLLLTISVSIFAMFIIWKKTKEKLVPNKITKWLHLSMEYLVEGKYAILRNFAITCTKTFVLGCSYWFSLSAYGQQPPFIASLCLPIIAGLTAYIPISFNGLGTVEASLIFLFAGIGVPSQQVFSAAITLRVLNILIISLTASSLGIISKKLRLIDPE